jgi:hypothetical protein
MEMARIRVDRLAVRFRGVSPEFARSAIDGLGGELVRELAAGRRPGSRRETRIEGIHSGNIGVESGSTPSDVRRRIAARIAAAVVKRTG